MNHRRQSGRLVQDIGSVSRLIVGVQNGSNADLEHLWHRYYHRLKGLARKRLIVGRRGVADEDDVASNVLVKFFARLQGGRIERVSDRHHLWRMLAQMTVWQASNQNRRVNRSRLRRTDTATTHTTSSVRRLSGLLDPKPLPATLPTIQDSIRHLLDDLGDSELRDIVLKRLSGMSLTEIALSINRSIATVERRLRLLRKKWEQELILD